MNTAGLWTKTQHLESQMQTGMMAKIQAFQDMTLSHCTVQVLIASKNQCLNIVVLACLTL